MCKFEILDGKFKGRQHVFKLTFSAPSNKSYGFSEHFLITDLPFSRLILSAESESDLNLWKAAVQLSTMLLSPVVDEERVAPSSSVVSRRGEEDEWAAGTGPGLDINKGGIDDDAETEIIAREEEVPRGGLSFFNGGQGGAMYQHLELHSIRVTDDHSREEISQSGQHEAKRHFCSE